MVRAGFSRADALEMTREERLAYLQVYQDHEEAAWERAKDRS